MIRLIDGFGLSNYSAPGLVVPLVYEGSSVVLKPISVGLIRANGHEQHRMVPSQSIIHAALEACAFSSAHFQVRDDFIDHRQLIL